MNAKNVPAWFPKWREKYAPMLVNGVTDGPTYVRLTVKECPMLTVDLAFRPYATRITEDILALGGKLSVFPRKDTLKAEPANAKTMVGWLTASFPDIEFVKKAEYRVGTEVLAMVKAPIGSKGAFLKTFDDAPFVDILLSHVEKMGHFEVQDRKLAIRALKEAYVGWVENLFLPGQDDHAEIQMGDMAHGDNIVPFVKKILKDAAKSEGDGGDLAP